jgi:hypothetical protein
MSGMTQEDLEDQHSNYHEDHCNKSWSEGCYVPAEANRKAAAGVSCVPCGNSLTAKTNFTLVSYRPMDPIIRSRLSTQPLPTFTPDAVTYGWCSAEDCSAHLAEFGLHGLTYRPEVITSEPMWLTIERSRSLEPEQDVD